MEHKDLIANWMAAAIQSFREHRGTYELEMRVGQHLETGSEFAPGYTRDYMASVTNLIEALKRSCEVKSDAWRMWR